MCANSAGYMVKYNHSMFKFVPFSDVAFKSTPDLRNKFVDYFGQKPSDAQHSLPGNFQLIHAVIL